MATSYDLAVVGSGPGGYVAAIRASQLGMKTAVIERSELGGICLNWGCIPTKALLRTSEIYAILHDLDAYGLSAKDIAFDIGKVVQRSRAVAGQLSKGVTFLMKKNKIDVVKGTAKLAGQGKLTVEQDGKTQDIAAKHIVLATGARARALPGIEPDGDTIWTYREAMVPKAMPKRLLVIGSGAIGIEFASFYATMGTDVTVVEVLDRILPVEDADVSAFALKAFKKQGMTVLTSAKVTQVAVTKGTAQVTIEAGGTSRTETFDKVILAVGITGNVENIGLEEAGVTVDRGHVQVDGYGRTGVEGVYAIGDLTGPPWLAHKASHEGIICVEKIAGLKTVHPLNTSNIPGCTYCRPQVASVGMTEAAAKDAGHKVRTGTFPFQGNGKAIALGEPEGFIKTVFDAKTGELLGAHMIGPEVTELIQGYAVARQLETTEAEVIETVFPHPTLSEAMHESVLDAYGRVIHT